jgi:hypothetical protein
MAKKKQTQQAQQLSPENYIRQKARNLPVFECMINEDWEFSKMASVSVARKHTNGNITLGLYLVDLNCLGVKDAHYLFNVSEPEYRRTISSNGNLDLITISYELAHNIVYAGLEFAKELGFNPHKDFSVARYILEEDTDEVELIEIECGKNGKPLYVKSEWQSDQDANRIMAQLERAVGKGNYDYIIPEKYNDEDEDDEEDEFRDMTYEEKKNLFSKLVISMEGQNKEDHKNLGDLVISVFNEFVNKDLVDELYDNYSDSLNVKVLPIEEIPFELWGVEPCRQIITDKISDLFIESYNLVNESTKKAGKKVKELKKILGDIPAVRLLELMILQVNGNEKESIEMILDNYATFPDYPLFKIQLLLIKIEGFSIPGELQNTIPGIKSLFGNRTSLHEIEFMNYILAMIELIDNEANAEKLEALQWAIEELELPESIDTSVYNEIMSIKFKLVIDYFTLKEKE